MADAADRPASDAETVKAQREAKKAAKAAKVAAAVAKKSDGTEPAEGGSAAADQPAVAASPDSSRPAAPSDAARAEPSPEEVKAQREAKKAAKAAKVAAAVAKKEGPEDHGPGSCAAAPEEVPVASEQRPELSPEEVKAQREAKKAAKAAKVAAAVSKTSDAPTASAPAAPAALAAAAPRNVTAAATPAKPVAAAAANAPVLSTKDAPALPLESPSQPLPTLPSYASVSYDVASVGLMCRNLRLVGSNARTLACLQAFIALLKSDGTVSALGRLTQTSKEDIMRVVRANRDFLAACRPLTAGTEFALHTFEQRLTRTADLAKTATRAGLVAIQHLTDITNDIQASMSELAAAAVKCISAGDVVLTYGRSSAIETTFAVAAADGIDFTVIIVDSAPLYEGRGMQWRLQQRGIKTCYVLLSSVCAIMAKATRVFIGASSVLQNGQVVARSGTTVVSLVAKQFSKPLICLCETYKYTERIRRGADGQTGSIARYDTTPKDLVDIIVSEIGFLHPTAIAAAIRDRNEKEARQTDPF